MDNQLSSLERQRSAYLVQAKQDVESRRAVHNAQLKSYDQQIKPLKRKQTFQKFSQAFANFGQRVGKMGPG